MKKRMFVIVGLALGLAAASFFIPLSDGNYWWSAWNQPNVTVVEYPANRLPAGTNPGTPIDTTGGDPTIPDEQVTNPEPEPVYPSNGKDQPVVPAPAPYIPPAPTGNCLDRAFSGQSNPRYGSISGVRFSSSYTQSYLSAAVSSPYKLGTGGNERTCGTSCKRLAIMGIMTAGYCSFVSKYQHPYQSATVLPRMNGRWDEQNLTERVNHWKQTQNRNLLNCGDKDVFQNERKKICSVVYKFCGLASEHINTDCYGFTPETGGDDHGGGTTTGATSGSTTGALEVEPGKKNDETHPANPSGDHGIEGPSGVSH